MKDAIFEDLLERGEFKSIHQNNVHPLLIETDKSKHHISPPIIRNFFDLKVNQYNVRRSYLFKLPATDIANMVSKDYVLKKVFLGIRFQANTKT